MARNYFRCLLCLALDQSRLEGLQLGPNITGVLTDLRFDKTLEAALTMQPNVRKVIVVAGTSEGDKKYLAKAKDQLRAFEGRVEFTYLIDSTMEEVENQLAKLSDDTITFFISFYRDKADHAFPPVEAMARVSNASPVPTYGPVDRYIDFGSIGGYV